MYLCSDFTGSKQKARKEIPQANLHKAKATVYIHASNNVFHIPSQFSDSQLNHPLQRKESHGHNLKDMRRKDKKHSCKEKKNNNMLSNSNLSKILH